MSILEVKDRIPTQVLDNGAIRYGVYDENNNLLRYEYMKREDEPIEEGTPINRALFRNLQGDLYTQDRYNVPTMSRRIVEANYETDMLLSEDLGKENLFPSTGWTEVSTSKSVNANGTTLSFSLLKSDIYPLSRVYDGDYNTYSVGYSSSSWCTLTFPRNIKVKKIRIKVGAVNANSPASVYDNKLDSIAISNGVETYTAAGIGGSIIDLYIDFNRFENNLNISFDLSSSTTYRQSVYGIEILEYYENPRYGKYEYEANLDIPLSSYETNKILNLQGSRMVDDTVKTEKLVPIIGWSNPSGIMAVNDDGSIIESSVISSYKLTDIIDNNDTTYYRSDGSTSSIYITYTFPYRAKITKMLLKQDGLGDSTTITISGSNSKADWETLYEGIGQYTTTQEVSLTGNLDYYRYYRLNLKGDSSVPQIYVWKPSEIQGFIYDTFVNPSININNLGFKKIIGKIEYGKKYSLVYKGEEWEQTQGIITGTYYSNYTDSETVEINLGLRPKYVVLFNSSNMNSSIAVSGAGSTYPSFVPRLITDLSSSDKITDTGFVMNLGSTGNANTKHRIYYLAIC